MSLTYTRQRTLRVPNQNAWLHLFVAGAHLICDASCIQSAYHATLLQGIYRLVRCSHPACNYGRLLNLIIVD